jgi:hypothetical protein
MELSDDKLEYIKSILAKLTPEQTKEIHRILLQDPLLKDVPPAADSETISRYFFYYCLLFIVYCLLFIVYCLLFIVYCLLFIVYCLLFIVYCLLFIVYCLLFIGYFLIIFYYIYFKYSHLLSFSHPNHPILCL